MTIDISMTLNQPTITQKNETKQVFDTLCDATQTKAKRAAEGFHGFLKQTLDNLIDQGRQLNQLKAQMQQELGQKEGNAAFKHWLNTEQWQFTRNMAQSAITIAKKYEKLPSKLKSQLRDKLNGWSATAIKELLQAGTKVLRKLMHRPTCSAAQVREVKKQLEEKEKLEQPVSDWTKVQKQYENLTTQDLEAIKEEAQREARQHNRAVQIKDIEKVADEFGYKKAKQTKMKDVPLNSVKERIANYAIRQAQLEDAFKTAPEEIKDGLAQQIQSCRSMIARLSKGLDIEANIPSEEIGPTQGTQDPELLQRIADLEQLVETLHQQNVDLVAKNSYSEPTATDSTLEAESDINDLKDLNKKLLKEIESLKKQVTKTPIQKPNEIADIKTIKAILESSFNNNWSWEEIERESKLPLKTIFKKTNLAIDQLETSCYEWQQKFKSTSQSLTTIEEELRLLKSRQDALAKENASAQQTLEHLLKLDSLPKPKKGDLVLVTQGPLKGITGYLFGTTRTTSLIETKQGDITYTRSTEYEYLIKIG